MLSKEPKYKLRQIAGLENAIIALCRLICVVYSSIKKSLIDDFGPLERRLLLQCLDLLS